MKKIKEKRERLDKLENDYNLLVPGIIKNIFNKFYCKCYFRKRVFMLIKDKLTITCNIPQVKLARSC
jgi:hypothetical protein